MYISCTGQDPELGVNVDREESQRRLQAVIKTHHEEYLEERNRLAQASIAPCRVTGVMTLSLHTSATAADNGILG